MIDLLRRTGLVSVFLILLLLSGTRLTAVSAQTDTSQDTLDAAQALLDEMNIEERVGQLFLVTFEGDTAVPESTITDLITHYRVGGVILRVELTRGTASVDAVDASPSIGADLPRETPGIQTVVVGPRQNERAPDPAQGLASQR